MKNSANEEEESFDDDHEEHAVVELKNIVSTYNQSLQKLSELKIGEVVELFTIKNPNTSTILIMKCLCILFNVKV